MPSINRVCYFSPIPPWVFMCVVRRLLPVSGQAGAPAQCGGAAAVLSRERSTQDERGGAAGEDPPPPAGRPKGEKERPQHPRQLPGEHAITQSLVY